MLTVCKKQLGVFGIALLAAWLGLVSKDATALDQVRALVYSSSAAEIQWNREIGEQIRVTYNNQDLGLFDSDSWFSDELDPTVLHRFLIQRAESGSEEVLSYEVSFSSANFAPPTREVRASESSSNEAATAGGLVDVRALMYSTTAAEVFWQRPDFSEVVVSINGDEFGNVDANSLFLPDLDPSQTYTVRLSHGSAPNKQYVLEINTGLFEGYVQALSHTSIDVEESQPSAPPPAQSAAPEPSSEIPEPASPAPAEPTIPTQAPDTVDQADTQEPPDTAPVVESDPPADDEPFTPAPQQAVQNGDCVVQSIDDLISCVDSAQGFDRINIQSDLSCGASNCCPTGGALLRFANVNQLTIEGNGHTLLRTVGQRQCSLLDITGSSDITLNNWQLDDDVSVSPCVVSDNCPRMLHIRNSTDISLDTVSVKNGKGYVIYVQQVNGFDFINSSLINSGVLGLYVGHTNQASTNINILNSTFLDNQTNALALLGVTGSSTSSNVVADNVFRRNHWRGQWAVEPRFGTGFTGGGQIYLAQVSGLTLRDNLIADGFCENCFIQQRFGTGVSGIEIALPGQNSVSQTLITGNTITNHDAWGVFVNEGSAINGSVAITNNTLTNNTQALNTRGGTVSGNSIQDR